MNEQLEVTRILRLLCHYFTSQSWIYTKFSFEGMVPGMGWSLGFMPGEGPLESPELGPDITVAGLCRWPGCMDGLPWPGGPWP